MKLWQKIILRLLYLTPFGYFLSTIFLLQGERTQGIYIDLRAYSPIRATIEKKPSFGERVNWFINGIFLLTEGWYVIGNQIAGSTGGAFTFIAYLYGLASLASAFFPSLSWNKKIF